MDLVDEPDLAAGILPKLVLGVHQQQAPLRCLRLSMLEKRERRRARLHMDFLGFRVLGVGILSECLHRSERGGIAGHGAAAHATTLVSQLVHTYAMCQVSNRRRGCHQPNVAEWLHDSFHLCKIGVLNTPLAEVAVWPHRVPILL